MSIHTEYNRWLSHPSVSGDERDELLAFTEDDKTLYFSGRLTFGTAGLRGVMKPGIGAMNIHTVAHATRALAALIKAEGGAERGAVIACDSRNNSAKFAKISAAVLAKEGVKAYIFEDLRPTPVLSFAVRHLGCIAGINITASHNPKQYNGYKAYWEDGAQLSPALAGRVAAYGDGIDVLGAEDASFDEGVASGMIVTVGKEIDEAYIAAVLEQRVDPSLLENASNMSIVYTPLNGAGHILVPEVLKRAGIKKLYTVPSQSEPNGDFPTTPYPNPEYKDVFVPGLAIAEEVGANFVIATDPDADRMGIAVRESGSEFVCLTGNQVGCLLLEYIISSLKNQGKLPKKAYAVKSFVSTELASRIAKANGVDMFDVFTGFKFIGETVTRLEDPSVGREFLLGFEESYGYLRGTYARDKDAVVASMLVCEAAAYYAKRGLTLYGAMQEIYEKYGHFADLVTGVRMEGVGGAEKIRGFMQKLRDTVPEYIGEHKVTAYIDYLVPEKVDTETKKAAPLDSGKADTMYFYLGDNVAVVRPSGTEPLVKFYAMASGKTREEAKSAAEGITEALKALI